MLIDTRRTSFDMRQIQNRRFMYQPQTGELILGYQHKSSRLVSSHAEEHFDSGANAPFDSFVRGWIGTGKDYKNGIIHFAPDIPAQNIEAFDKGFSTLQMFSENNANGDTVIRGFGGVWEQPLNNLITERSDRMNEYILEAYISNRRKYVEGDPLGEWVKFPTTQEEMNEVFRRIGMDGIYYTEIHITEYNSAIPGLARCLSEMEHLDELNYLAKVLEAQDETERTKFAAAVAHGEYTGSIKDLINLAQNLDCYELYPDILKEEHYGYYLIEEQKAIDLPREAWDYFDFESYGSDTAINQGGRFTEQGYIYNNRSRFTEHYDGREVPEEYRLSPQPEQPGPEKADFDTIGAAQAAEPEQPRPVVPIILNSKDPAEKLKEITGRLEQGIQAVFESERYKEYLNAMSKFHDYSFNNTILIAMQGGNLVKGYAQWKKDFDRQVKKDETGIKIFAPAPYKTKRRVTKIDPDTQKPMLDKDGKPIKEEQEITVPAFKVVSVFDISQTEGKEFPDLSVKPLLADVEQYEDFFAALEAASPVPIAFEEISGSANGYFHLEDKRIAIKEGVSELQAVKTAIHEIAHAKLHDVDLNAPKEEQNRVDRRTREVQAESVAYTVCQHFGLDTSDYSFAYVAGWSSGKEMNELKSSLETIQQTAKELINTVEGRFTELQQQRETDRQQENTFSIYQLKDGDETRDLRFEPYDRLQAAGKAVDPANYELAYTAPLAPDMTLESIWQTFNTDHPADFKGRSVSMSDVIVLHQDGQDTAHYVDKGGYRQVPEFLQPQENGRGSVFKGLPPDKQRELTETVQATLQTMVDADKRIYGDVTGGTLEAIAAQGFTYRDGQLEKQPQGIHSFIESELNEAGIEFTHFKSAEQFQAWVQAHADPQKQQPEMPPDSLKTGEKIETPRGRFSVTDMTREQIEAAGYGFHHASDDGKYLIMANGTYAFAIAAEQPQNHLKHIEDTVEQNDNSFDGIINNTPQTPTVAELEQKAKSGEPISVIDLANAVKAEKREQPPKKRSILKQLDEYKKQAAQQPQKQQQKNLKQDREV